GEPDHAGFAGGHSVWFRWTAPHDGRARVSVFTGTTWDSLLGVYTGASVGALTQVAANDDAPYGSQVSFGALAGTRYWIAVDGKIGALTAVPIDQSTYQRTVGLQAGVTYSIQVSDDAYGGLGAVVLAWRFGVPVNDNFANARWINSWSDSTYDTNSGATKEAG